MGRKQTPQQRDLPEVLTKEEAAAFLRCSPQKVQRLTRDGYLTPYRIGQRPRYPLRMLREFIAQETGHHDHTAAS